MLDKIQIVKEAIKALERNKGIKLKLIDIKEDRDGGVDTVVDYPKPWNHKDYGFTADWFTSKKIDIESYSWMNGFSVPDALRITQPTQVCILRIAYYFYKHGIDYQLI